MCFPFGTDINVNVIAPKRDHFFLFGHNYSRNWNCQPPKWHSAEIQGNHWGEGRVLGATAGGEVSQHQKMCSQLISPFWIILPLWVCIFSHEDNEVQAQIYYGWRPPCGLHETCNKLLQPWLWKTTFLHPMPKFTLKLGNDICCTYLWKTCYWSTFYLGIMAAGPYSVVCCVSYILLVGFTFRDW